MYMSYVVVSVLNSFSSLGAVVCYGFLFSFAEAVVKCRGRGIVYDECDRQCTCVNGRMTECFRVRKEFTTLSNEEKRRYLQAYYKITTEEPLKSRFVKFISKHAKWFWKGLISTLIFLLIWFNLNANCVPFSLYSHTCTDFFSIVFSFQSHFEKHRGIIYGFAKNIHI